MDVKTTFLNGILKEEVYVGQPPGLISKQYPDHVYALDKTLYGLKQTLRAEWIVFPSGFQELEVRKNDQSYGVSLQHKVCQCRMWELRGVPCVHVVPAYLHCGIDLDLGVSHWYSQECWFNTYQFSNKLIFGSNMWKRTNDVPPLSPLVIRLPGRSQKARIKAPCESSGSHTSRVGRTMTYTNCWQKGHNRATCTADLTPKPTVEKKQPGRKKQVVVGHCASRDRGRGRSGIGNEASGSTIGGIGEASGGGRGGSGGRGIRGGGMASSGGRRGGRTGSRGIDSTRGGGMAGSSSMGILTSKELDELAFRECMEEQAREQARIGVEQARIGVEQESIHSQPTQQSGVWVKDTTDVTIENIDEAPTSETTDVSAIVKDLSAPAVDKGKGKESVEDQSSAPKKKRGMPPSHVDGIRIYHKNRGKSKRIANMKEKKAFQFDKHGTCSTPDKAFDVDD
ncbi:zinc finger, PMZ-type containing protein [Tanacetum coccineum]